MKKNVTLADKSGSKTFILPIVPQKIQKINPTKNQLFETTKGDLNIIGNVGLKEASWESFFPNKEYPFAASGSSANGWEYVDFLNNAKDNKLPIRYVETDESKHTILNMLASVEKFDYDTDAVGDVIYSIELKEWKNEL